MRFHYAERWHADGDLPSFNAFLTCPPKGDAKGIQRKRETAAVLRRKCSDEFDREFEALIKNEPGSGLVLAY